MEHLGTTKIKIFNTVRESGLPVQEFDCKEEGPHITLTHAPSKHWFRFDRGERFDGYSIQMTSFTPRQTPVKYTIRTSSVVGRVRTRFNIDHCIKELLKWLGEVVMIWRIEASMPDPWQSLKDSYENINKSYDDESLSDDEAARLKEGIKSLPEFLATQFEVPEGKKEQFRLETEQVVKTVMDKIDRKETRKQIRQYIEGAIIEKALEWGVSKVIDYVLPKFLELIQKILTLPMPPSGI